MKTFETEKHNIPEGATHTCDGVFVKMNDESKDSGWCKVWFEGKWHRNGYLSNCVKIEDQTNIETPEEKEVFDSMKQSNDQSEINKPAWAKWSIGDSVTKTKGSSWTGKVAGYYQTDLTSKGYAVESETEKGSVQIYPEAALYGVETEAERVERERDEFKVEICKDLEIEAVGCNTACIINKLYELGYRKES